jgi:hypothetical protein
MAALADFRYHRHSLGLGAAADGKSACDRPTLDAGGKLSGKRLGLAGSHFKIWQFLNLSLPRVTNYGWLDLDSARQCGVPDFSFSIDCELAEGRAL